MKLLILDDNMIPSFRIFLIAVLAAFLLSKPASAEYLIESMDNDYKSEVEAAAEEGKRLVLFFHQAGCPYCDKMRARVLPMPKIMDYFSENFVMIESNVKGNLDIVMPDGTEGNERAFALKIRVRATPVFVFYDTDAKAVLRTTGFMDVERFHQAGKYVVDGEYKTGKSFFRYLQEQN